MITVDELARSNIISITGAIANDYGVSGALSRHLSVAIATRLQTAIAVSMTAVSASLVTLVRTTFMTIYSLLRAGAMVPLFVVSTMMGRLRNCGTSLTRSTVTQH